MSQPNGRTAVPAALRTFVLDAGALIAIERTNARMTALLRRVRAGQATVIVSDAVLAQVWRGGSGRQSRLAALIGLKPDQCLKVPLDTAAAQRIGRVIGECGHSDVVDVHVALLAEDYHGAVITSDADDILAVKPDLKNLIVEI